MTAALAFWTCVGCGLDFDAADEMPRHGMSCARCFARANAREQIADVIERLRGGDPQTSWGRVEMIACLLEAQRCITIMSGDEPEEEMQ